MLHRRLCLQGPQLWLKHGRWPHRSRVRQQQENGLTEGDGGPYTRRARQWELGVCHPQELRSTSLITRLPWAPTLLPLENTLPTFSP